MLENDFVGQRSGTRPLAGVVVYQNLSKVRRWTGSRYAVWAAVGTKGAAVLDAGAVADVHAVASAAIATHGMTLRRILEVGIRRNSTARPAPMSDQLAEGPSRQPSVTVSDAGVAGTGYLYAVVVLVPGTQ
jgi:hypothetical protein